MNIYVSSASVDHDCIENSIIELSKSGYRKIELSGGSDYHSGILQNLINLQQEYELNYTVHNYFPPPKEHFVLNLASTNEDCWQRSIDHCKDAMSLASLIGSDRYSIHAGFLVDLQVEETGGLVKARSVSCRETALARFAYAHEILKREFPLLKLFVENNVITKSNFINFGQNPFLMTDFSGFLELDSASGGINLLLDLAHLKVACRALSLDFAMESQMLLMQSEYLHISDNDGLSDSNLPLVSKESEIYQSLIGKITDMFITCEVYSGLDDVNRTIETLRDLGSSSISSNCCSHYDE